MMKHQKIPGNSHLKEPNPYLKLDNSPFFLVKNTQDWLALNDEQRNLIPRRAGVSSFGIGGTNVHLVLEEYCTQSTAKVPEAIAPNNDSCIILSAKDSDRLLEVAQNLYHFLIANHEANLGEPLRLCDIAYTLQVGREEMDYRLGFIASSITDLEAKLSQFINAKVSSQTKAENGTLNIYEGCIKEKKYSLDIFGSDDDLQGVITKWFEGQKYEQLLKLWVNGLLVNWEQLYREDRRTFPLHPKRISLPSYPFAREHYWLPITPPVPITASASEITPIIRSIIRESTPASTSDNITTDSATDGCLFGSPIWQEKSTSIQPEIVNQLEGYSQQVILWCGVNTPAEVLHELGGTLDGPSICHTLQIQSKDLAENYQNLCEQVITHLQRILEQKPRNKVLVQIIISSPKANNFSFENTLLHGLVSLLKTAHLENPKITGQLIEVNPDYTPEQLIRCIRENSHLLNDIQIRYRQGRREVLSWQELPGLEQTKPQISWKEGGVYLITGGAGGLGLIFTRDIARRVKKSTIILVGRSPLTFQKQAQLQQEAHQLGARIDYRPTDISQSDQVQHLIQGILRDYGKINGILHGAGVICDSFILKKSINQLHQVFAPKVRGTVYLDQATNDLNLDFFVLFSSGTAVVGNAGQADYAAANAFMDAYAHYRHALVESGQRFGRSLSINWPLWQDGGMQVDAPTLQELAQQTGIKALQTENGVNALLHALNLKPNQIMVLEGDRPRLRQGLFNASTPAQPSPDSSLIVDGKSDEEIDEKQLLAQTIDKCKNLFGRVIKLDGDRIDSKAPLENYGIDSVIITQMNRHLESILGEISKTLLYEYQTLEELANYLIIEYRDQCLKWTALRPQPLPPASNDDKDTNSILNGNLTLESVPLATALATQSPKKLVTKLTTTTQTTLECEPIAIIGLAGRYAQAETVQDYWENLRAGRDCVTEIPPERWSLDGFYHEDLETAMTQGKSYSKWGSFITGFADFDPLFFSISPREAAGIDPQERLFLQSAWTVLEDAGYTRDILRDQFQQQVGVFVGITKTGFNLYGPELWRRGEVVYPQTSFSSVANRISYLLNLRGPSLPIDTMCSSSLTAIHEACEHIRRRECELAIAGGVNLYLHPSSYIQMCAAHMLSQDGQCKSFGAGGNGFVPGEGVGTVLLKPLDRAIADRDHIYAVIRGSSVNHGGKTNGYTVPNPKAQAELIKATLSKTGINARTISYIEAHGTGTELGDPIEITGLTQAFQQHTADTGFCAVGSAKSNLGHLEAAAGIAGLTKIILQLQHGQLAPSLHAAQLNPNINFTKTPFVVQQTLSAWERPQIEVDGEITTVPRRAGISSFGAGGSNAHLIIEEYVEEYKNLKRDGTETHKANVSFQVTKDDIATKAKTNIKEGDRRPQIIVLSARNRDRLDHIIQNLRHYLDTESSAKISLSNLAYTLQTGREAMTERLAFVVDSLEELKQTLSALVTQESNIQTLYRGQVKPHGSSVTLPVTLFDDEEEVEAAIDRWLKKGKLDKIAQLWCQGLTVDWNRLHQGQNPYRISLPTYPFEAKKYWIKDILKLNESQNTSLDRTLNDQFKTNNAALSKTPLLSKLHPLVHQNISNFYQQRFSSSFTGEEFFLADHRVQGKRVLPGVAYLEMARMAIALALDEHLEAEKLQFSNLQFSNVVWPQPIVVGDQPVKVHTTLQLDAQDGAMGDRTTIQFEICTTAATNRNDDVAPVLHCQGWVELDQGSIIPTLDLYQLQQQCQLHQVSADQCYQVFASAGIQYGPGHQAIKTLYVGQQQVLAKLELPPSIADTAKHFGLHPSLLDSALQASLGLAMGQDDGAVPQPSMPYALEVLELYETEVQPSWAWIRESSDSSTTIQKLDVDLCDQQGRISVRMRGFSSRMLERTLEPSVVSAAANTATNLALLSPVWNVVNLPSTDSFQEIITSDQVLVIGGSHGQKVALEQTYPDALWISGSNLEEVRHFLQAEAQGIEVLQIIWIAPEGAIASIQQESLITDQNAGVLHLFRLLKVLLACGYGDKTVQWTVITTQAQAVRQLDGINPTHAAIHGLIGSLAKEYPHWPIRLVDLDANQAWPIDDILRLPADQHGDAIAYRGGEWFKQTLVPITESQSAKKSCYRSQGVYVVIGGAGGIGEAWSRWMIEQYQAQIIWMGRRPVDTAIQAKLDSLAKLGTPPRYIAADASDRQALQAAYQQIKRDYGPVHGVIHSAIVLADRSLANMDESLFQLALQAKVDVSVRLAQVFANETLDFVLFFSSTQSFAKMPGQSNYAAGCTFKDAFAHRMAQEWSCPVKVMNWSYWGSVGIVASSAYRDRMAQIGVGSIEPHEGMAAIQSLLESPLNQLALIKQLNSQGNHSSANQQELAEWITTYEEELPNCMDDLQSYLVTQPLPILNLSS